MDVHRTESAPDLSIDDRSKQGFVKWFRQLEANDVQQGVSGLVKALKTYLCRYSTPVPPSSQPRNLAASTLRSHPRHRSLPSRGAYHVARR